MDELSLKIYEVLSNPHLLSKILLFANYKISYKRCIGKNLNKCRCKKKTNKYNYILCFTHYKLFIDNMCDFRILYK
jgi:hypothetical protein